MAPGFLWNRYGDPPAGGEAISYTVLFCFFFLMKKK